MHEAVAPSGRLRITMIDPADGRVLLRRRFANLVTLAGRQLLAEMLIGAKRPKGMQLVVGGPDDPAAQTPPPELADTALANQKLGVDVQFGTPTADNVDGKPRFVTAISGTLTADGGDDLVLTEAGILVTRDDDTRILYNRVVFPTITKQGTLQMTLSWDVIF